MSLNDLLDASESKLVALENEFREIDWKLSSRMGDQELLVKRRDELPNLIGEAKLEIAFARVKQLRASLEAIKADFDQADANARRLHDTNIESSQKMQAELEYTRKEEQEATWKRNLLESKLNEQQRDLLFVEGELKSLLIKYDYVYNVVE
jgi:chromosome segregation ATPase